MGNSCLQDSSIFYYKLYIKTDHEEDCLLLRIVSTGIITITHNYLFVKKMLIGSKVKNNY